MSQDEAGAPLHLLLSEAAWREHGAAMREASARPLQPVLFAGAEAPPPELSRVEAAFLSRDVFAGGTGHRPVPGFLRYLDLLHAAPALRWLHIYPAGVDREDYQRLMRRGVRLTNSASAIAPTVALTAFTALLALSRRMPGWIAAQAERRWQQPTGAARPRDLAGQTAVIVGTGPIGQEIGRLCAAVGLRVLGVRHGTGAPPPHLPDCVTYAELPQVLPRADWLVLACPLSDATRGLIDAAALALLPPGAHLLNASRGGVAVDAAIDAALRAGRLAGAWLDVFESEPLAPDSPLWSAPGALVTPHCAGVSDGREARVATLFAENLGRWTRGETLPGEARPS
ncbi:D-2-hydroxyacid dehydrogenase [Roseomonas sp. NAR14]|uniref:D-2-hydroxyacid dehydrogenase n=1 Tax=Roseomonas acroporae TaxID=2937791 RepID=A0A9X1YCS3_9PROT|nr:D-2-hydroxyacid dehydrogenase [Roseomonas acroporae]MCK8784111.1 D-2-hydroxyacid dehydrogenase [Roseomonas acroporae]